MTGNVRGTSQQGFTLLELLVALAVFAVIAVAAYSGLQSVLAAQVAIETQAERLAELQMAFHFLERDLEQAAPRGIRDEYGQQRPALESGGTGGDLIAFSRAGWDNPLGQPRAGLQRLSYRLQDGRLQRRYWSTLDRGGFEEPRAATLLNKVEKATIRFLDEQDEWQSEWPPFTTDQSAVLPRAVEISIALADWGEIRRLFRLPAL